MANTYCNIQSAISIGTIRPWKKLSKQQDSARTSNSKFKMIEIKIYAIVSCSNLSQETSIFFAFASLKRLVTKAIIAYSTSIKLGSRQDSVSS